MWSDHVLGYLFSCLNERRVWLSFLNPTSILRIPPSRHVIPLEASQCTQRSGVKTSVPLQSLVSVFPLFNLASSSYASPSSLPSLIHLVAVTPSRYFYPPAVFAALYQFTLDKTSFLENPLAASVSPTEDVDRDSAVNT